ncbi:hypothetical protein AB0L99_14230 [Streptomyces sp. NPDC051954]|uniref:hypothetical protein n=1 Tax=unclassified Streptomyces TaxID=2593676 RepID=UPI003419D015
MTVRTLQLLFRLTVIGFLAGGFLIVIGQALGIALGDAGWVAAVEEHAGPPTFIVAGVSGLLAFVLSYLTTEERPDRATLPAGQDLQPVAGTRPE